MRPILRISALLATVLSASAGPAFALTKEAAIESCRERVGRPIVMACMRGGGGSLESCRAKAHPQVHACVIAALNAETEKLPAGTPIVLVAAGAGIVAGAALYRMPAR